MVIVNYEAGQLCNRLFHFAHFIANSTFHQYKLIYPYFNEYKRCFENFDEKASRANIGLNLVKIQFLNKRSLRLLRKLNHRSLLIQTKVFSIHDVSVNDSRGEDFDMNSLAFVKACKQKKLLTRGWLYRDEKHFNQFANLIRELFVPAKQYRGEVEEIMQGYRRQYDIIVGVHIRRGDYKEFESGKWFYQDDVYVEKIQELRQELSKKYPLKAILFHLFSNEDLDLTAFEGISIAFKSRHFITDLYCLSSCDYIIGAPSTYSTWASFYGKVPLYHIYNKEAPISLERFRYVIY